MGRYCAILAVAVAGGIVTGAGAADDAKAVQGELRDARSQLSNYERGRFESPAVREARANLAKIEAEEKAKAEADLKAKPEAVEVQAGIAKVDEERKAADAKVRETMKAIEASPELVALKAKVDEAQAAWKAKFDEMVKANTALTDLTTARDTANKAIAEANAKLIQIRLAGNKEVEAIKARIAELEKKLADIEAAKKAAAGK